MNRPTCQITPNIAAITILKNGLWRPARVRRLDYDVVHTVIAEHDY